MYSRSWVFITEMSKLNYLELNKTKAVLDQNLHVQEDKSTVILCVILCGGYSRIINMHVDNLHVFSFSSSSKKKI